MEREGKERMDMIGRFKGLDAGRRGHGGSGERVRGHLEWDGMHIKEVHAAAGTVWRS